MTEFEQQVADFIASGVRHLPSCAVRAPSAGGDYLAVCNCGRDDALALRVAAAIIAAATEGARIASGRPIPMDAAVTQMHAAALAALRGEP